MAEVEIETATVEAPENAMMKRKRKKREGDKVQQPSGTKQEAK